MTNLQGWMAARDKGARSPRHRAEYYRGKAERLRQMAGWEPVGKMRDRLNALARSYEELADAVDRRAASDG